MITDSAAVKTSFETLPIEGYPFGAQVLGLRQDMLQDEAVRRDLYDLWVEKGLLIFRGVTGPEFQIELSRVFGDLIQHSVTESRTSPYPELARGRYIPEEGSIVELNGEKRGDWLPWHTDTIYREWINRGGLLRPVVLTSKWGKTGFIDKLTAYDGLPDELKEKIEGVEVIYKMNFEYDKQKFATPNGIKVLQLAKGAEKIHARSDDFPRVVHPAVFTHKDFGRKAFNISPSQSLGIVGMEGPEGDALLRELIRYGIDESKAYFHDWRPDDMVLWDNWRLLHCATGCPPEEERWMERTTIAGDYGFGRLESAAA